MPIFLKSKPALAVTLLLVLQGVLVYGSIRTEILPASRSLSEMPKTLGSWQTVSEGVIEPEIQEVLKADDVLNRTFKDTATGRGADLFVAAYRTQRTGKTLHSPKNCLPGAGWTQMSAEEIALDPGNGAPISVNRYVVAHGNSQSVVLYWYQSRDRVVAGEYKAKFWVLADAIRLNRTDTALVRVIVPIADHDADLATRTATDFVKSFFTTLRGYLPS